MKKLISEYKKKKRQIRERLRQFKRLKTASDEDIFAELCFCILTPQSKAVHCDKAVRELKDSFLLFNGCLSAIRERLKGVRFPNNKAVYLIAVRDFFRNGRRISIKGRLDNKDIQKTRDWLVKNVKGIGYKEASHFLRNIGLGGNLAILDVHILKNLKRYKVISEVPAALSKKRYLEIEDRMRRFARRISIPMDELDLLFWSNQTGFVFK